MRPIRPYAGYAPNPRRIEPPCGAPEHMASPHLVSRVETAHYVYTVWGRRSGRGLCEIKAWPVSRCARAHLEAIGQSTLTWRARAASLPYIVSRAERDLAERYGPALDTRRA